MRHYYKSHGKHCYLRSFHSKCPKCNASILYWECTHGCKVFFEYPPYGKLVKHFCRHHRELFNIKKSFQNIVIKPKRILQKQSPSCPVCGKLFKEINSLEDHLEDLKKTDIYHKLFFNNKIIFEKDFKEDKQKDSNHMKSYEYPTFGKINIKKDKKIN
ncbi:MAG: hypothetical protein ACFE91_11200 [Promethearchaeota archaeon]